MFASAPRWAAVGGHKRHANGTPATGAGRVTTRDRMIEVNLIGSYLTCRSVVPHMVAKGLGRIVNRQHRLRRRQGRQSKRVALQRVDGRCDRPHPIAWQWACQPRGTFGRSRCAERAPTTTIKASDTGSTITAQRR
ncbi:protein of unknown function [Paraburkholderia kururiensis]